MAKYTVTYKCGHQKEVQLYGKESDRQKKIAWYATIDCPDCEAEMQKEMSDANGLPSLTGSEKQIAWATKLRNQALEILNAHIEAYVAPQNQPIIKAARDKWIANETASTYWIDNRFELSDLRSIINLIQKSAK